jgi:hypothetical protein
VQAAAEIGNFYHLKDGHEQRERDRALAEVDWDSGVSRYEWAGATYQQELLAYDVFAGAKTAFDAWESGIA